MCKPAAMVSRANPIVVIDDDPSIRQVTRLVLEAEGYRVFDCETTQAGLALTRELAAQRPVVLLDLNLHHETGLAFLRALDPAERTVRVAVISAMPEVYAEHAEELTRADALLGKPVGVQPLLELVARLTAAPNDQGDPA
ncbi:MAG: response regulator [Planctomycetota bacterium]